jgi:hypothetical protein
LTRSTEDPTTSSPMNIELTLQKLIQKTIKTQNIPANHELIALVYQFSLQLQLFFLNAEQSLTFMNAFFSYRPPKVTNLDTS